MARGTTAEERATATLIPLDSVLSGDDDTERAFDEFRESFQTGDEPGTVRAWELTIDERGNIGTTKAQIRLGAWPIDAYRFDELCAFLTDKFMEPTQTRMAVRLCGTKPGQTGYVFNKIVMLKRAVKAESSRDASESTASIMKMMQENNERMMQMFKQMMQPAERKDPMDEMQRMLAFSQMVNGPNQELMKLLIPALVGRPVASAPAASDPFASLGSLMDVAERLSEMRGGSGDSGGDSDSWVNILKAVTPLAKPALEALPAIAALAPKAPVVIPAPQPARVAGPAKIATQPAQVQPAPAPGAITQPTDIPSEDQVMLAQLKPQIDALVQMAEQQSDPVGAADLIFDQVFMDPNLPDEIYERLAGFVDSPQFVNSVCVMTPAAKPHAVWFNTFKAQIVKRINDETVAADAPTVLPAQ